MVEQIKAMRSQGDSVGGVIECRVRNLPVGLGVPVFDRLEADLAKAMLSLPATKGFEVGSGFEGTRLLGSQHNDAFVDKDGHVGTASNRSGGVQGGISNGEDLIFRVAFKPTATILQSQATVNSHGQATELMGRGRHDPCVLPRAVPIVEAMTALVLADHWMRHKAQCESFNFLALSNIPMSSPEVYLIFGIHDSGRRSLLLDLIEDFKDVTQPFIFEILKPLLKK